MRAGRGARRGRDRLCGLDLHHARSRFHRRRPANRRHFRIRPQHDADHGGPADSDRMDTTQSRRTRRVLRHDALLAGRPDADLALRQSDHALSLARTRQHSHVRARHAQPHQLALARGRHEILLSGRHVRRHHGLRNELSLRRDRNGVDIHVDLGRDEPRAPRLRHRIDRLGADAGRADVQDRRRPASLLYRRRLPGRGRPRRRLPRLRAQAGRLRGDLQDHQPDRVDPQRRDVLDALDRRRNEHDRRQRSGTDANQHQAHAGLLRHRAFGLHAGGRLGRPRRR